MTPQELHLGILSYAFQGHLSEQSYDDGTGLELLNKIKLEKERQIKAKIIKKEKELPAITDEDIPFDIPESWAWAYVGDIFLHNTGKAQNSSGSENGIVRKFITTSNLYWNRFDFSKVKEMPFTEKELLSCTVIKGDLLVCEGGDCGRSAIWTYDEAVCIQNHVHRLRPYVEISIEYFYHLFYLYKFTGKLRGRGVGIQGLSNEAIHQVICPLPPLAEQKRIVSKLGEILPLIDRYEAAWNKLEEFNKRFPGDMQKSILQLAIQGKLVEQRPEEGTGEELFQQIQAEKQALIKAGTIKKEKPLPTIAEDEIPLEIPDTWKWARWGDLSQSIQYGYNAAAQEKGRSKMVRISDIQNGKVMWESVPYCDIDEKDIPAYLLSTNDILFARTGGTVGKSYLVKDVPEEAVYAGYLIRTQYSSLLCPEFMKYFMESKLYWDQLRNGTIATAQPNCNGKTLAKMILPLPPLAEQKRIVAKLEEILPLCDRLK